MTDNNDQILVRELIKQKHADLDPDLSLNEFFELYAASEMLKNYDLNSDEIKSGIIGGSHDGGIDGLFIFHNSELLLEDKKSAQLPKQNVFDVYVFQTKFETGFGVPTLEFIRHPAADCIDERTCTGW